MLQSLPPDTEVIVTYPEGSPDAGKYWREPGRGVTDNRDDAFVFMAGDVMPGRNGEVYEVLERATEPEPDRYPPTVATMTMDQAYQRGDLNERQCLIRDERGRYVSNASCTSRTMSRNRAQSGLLTAFVAIIGAPTIYTAEILGPDPVPFKPTTDNSIIEACFRIRAARQHPELEQRYCAVREERISSGRNIGKYYGPRFSGYVTRDKAGVFRVIDVIRQIASGDEQDTHNVIEILAEMPPLAEGKRCCIEQALHPTLIQLLKVSPENPIVRTQVHAAVLTPIPDEAKSYEQIKDWVETNCTPKRRGAAIGATVVEEYHIHEIESVVDYTEETRGTCRFRDSLYGHMQLSVSMREVLDIARSCREDDETMEEIVSKVCELLETRCYDNPPQNLESTDGYPQYFDRETGETVASESNVRDRDCIQDQIERLLRQEDRELADFFDVPENPDDPDGEEEERDPDEE